MIRNPKVGELVQIWFHKGNELAAAGRIHAYLHGRLAVLRIIGHFGDKHLVEVVPPPGSDESPIAVGIAPSNLRRPPEYMGVLHDAAAMIAAGEKEISLEAPIDARRRLVIEVESPRRSQRAQRRANR